MEALEILKEHHDDIAILLLDMMMPQMGGKDTLLEKKKLKEAEHVPVIVISAETDSKLQLDMLSLGVIDYVTKPFEVNIMRQKVLNAIQFSEQFMSLRMEYAEDMAQLRREQQTPSETKA